MAVNSSGPIYLNTIHVEAGGTSGTACTINDSDIRGLNAAPGRTIPTGSGTAIELSDFYGANNTPRITVTNGQGGSYIVGASSYYFNGFGNNIRNTAGQGHSTGTRTFGSISGDTYLYPTNGGFRQIIGIYVAYHTNSTSSDYLVFTLNGNIANTTADAGWNTVRLYHAGQTYGAGVGNFTDISRYYATYTYDSTNNQTHWAQQYYTGMTGTGNYNIPPFYTLTNSTTYVEIY